ncbi:unnamed protein product [Mytilus coruscus]|uniref:TIR domain-containing protein n=1 Tax=Mytilus coruscus TaxID=42192 RepID=A0A6J8BST9_MYTCO|nr:unnamed protein product [Mytilus coruscus]
MKNKCPLRCTCFQQPSKERVVVNCTFSNQTKLPSYVPDFDNLDIDMSRNQLKYVQYEEYLNRTKRIDLSYNDIIRIDHLIYKIKTMNYINLYKNRISFFDKAILQKRPCNLVLGEIKTKCRCEMFWIKTWLERDSSQNCSQNRVTCDLKSEHIDAMLLSKDDFCPVERKDRVVFTALIRSFKYEIKLLSRQIRNRFLNTKMLNSEMDRVYISLNDENREARVWVTKTLKVNLEQHGLETCLPCLDYQYGGLHVEQIYDNIKQSRFFIVVLTEDSQESQLQNIELNHIWSSFKCEDRENIVVINFDALDSAKICDRRLRALCRLGYTLDFCNFDHRLLCNVRNRLNISQNN